MKKVITTGLLTAFLVSPFAIVSASSANVAVASDISSVSQVSDAMRIKKVWDVGTRVVKTKRVQAAAGAVTGFVQGFFDGGDDESRHISDGMVIPETALD